MRHFLTTSDWTRPELQSLIADAVALRTSPYGNALEGKTVALLFLNNSLRTRKDKILTAFAEHAYRAVVAGFGQPPFVVSATPRTWFPNDAD